MYIFLVLPRPPFGPPGMQYEEKEVETEDQSAKHMKRHSQKEKKAGFDSLLDLVNQIRDKHKINGQHHIKV